MIHPWARHPVDDEESYSYFCEWLHEVPRRSIIEWASWCSIREDGTRRPIMDWAHDNLWKERAEAFDAWTAEEPIRTAYPVLSPLALRLVRIATVEVGKYERAQALAGDAPGFISIDQIVRITNAVAKLEAYAKSIKAIEKSLSGGQAYDPSKLTDAELRQYSDLAEKMAV